MESNRTRASLCDGSTNCCKIVARGRGAESRAHATQTFHTSLLSRRYHASARVLRVTSSTAPRWRLGVSVIIVFSLTQKAISFFSTQQKQRPATARIASCSVAVWGQRWCVYWTVWWWCLVCHKVFLWMQEVLSVVTCAPVTIQRTTDRIGLETTLEPQMDSSRDC